jgi:hypothetical protein
MAQLSKQAHTVGIKPAISADMKKKHRGLYITWQGQQVVSSEQQSQSLPPQIIFLTLTLCI